VAVVGGGMVGATLACILARAGIRTVLLEGRPPVREWSENTTDLRVSALTMASRTVLDTLGVWPSIAARRAEAYRFTKVWDGDFGGQLFFDGADIGHDVLGYIQRRVPTFKLKYSKTAGSKYYANTCPGCGVISGDFYLHSEPGAPFFPTDKLYRGALVINTKAAIQVEIVEARLEEAKANGMSKADILRLKSELLDKKAEANKEALKAGKSKMY